MSIECPICSDAFNTDSNVISTECGHVMHRRCIDQWLQNSSRRTCPICRKTISSRFTKLFLNFPAHSEEDQLREEIRNLKDRLKESDVREKNIKKGFREQYMKLQVLYEEIRDETSRLKNQIRQAKAREDELKKEIEQAREKILQLEDVILDDVLMQRLQELENQNATLKKLVGRKEGNSNITNHNSAMSISDQNESETPEVKRSFNVGDRVAVWDFVDWRRGRIVIESEDCHYEIYLDDDRVVRRHVDQIRKIVERCSKGLAQVPVKKQNISENNYNSDVIRTFIPVKKRNAIDLDSNEMTKKPKIDELITDLNKMCLDYD